MAVAPRKSSITREQVRQWIVAWKRANNLPTFNTSLPDYIRQQVDALNLPDRVINTVAHDDLGDETDIVDMILMDLKSYG